MLVSNRNKTTKPPVTIHAVNRDFKHLNSVPGLDDYWNRTAMRSGDIVVAYTTPNDPEYLQVLADYAMMGIGPSHIIWVPKISGNFYQDILTTPHARKEIIGLAKKGHPIDMFCSSEEAVSFVSELGLNWRTHTRNPTRLDYLTWGDKAKMRTGFERLGFGNLLLPHGMAHTKDALAKLARTLSESNPDGVMFKRRDCASSEGIQMRRPGDLPSSDFMDEFWDPEHGFIVETGFEHHPFSISYLFDELGAHPTHFSIQWQGTGRVGELITLEQLLRRDLDHRGNAVGSPGMDLGPIHASDVQEMASDLQPGMNKIHAEGFRGMTTVDCLRRRPEERPFHKQAPLEMNPRNAHSGFAEGARIGLEANMPNGTKLCVLAANVEIKIPVIGIKDAGKPLTPYEVVKMAVPNFARPNVPRGVLFYHSPLFKRGKGGIIAFGETFEEARKQYEQAEEPLMNR